MNRTILAAGIFAFAVSAPVAFAADTGTDTKWYGGISVGETDFDGCDSGAGVTFTSCDDSDTGWKFFGGYNFNQNFGAEIGWVDLGEISAAGTVGAAPFTANAEIDGFQAVAVGRLPLGYNFSLFGKLGFYAWDAKASATVAGVGSGFAEDDGVDVTFGFGGQYDFSTNFGVRAEWERFDIDNDDVDLLSVGVVFKF